MYFKPWSYYLKWILHNDVSVKVSNICVFPKRKWCFRYAEYVSNLICMFPIYYPTYSVSNMECMFVHYTIFVSKCRWIIWDDVSNVCFQYTTLFFYKTIFLSIFWKLLFIIRAVRALRGEKYLCHLWSIFDVHAQPTLKTIFPKIFFSRDSVAQK